MPAAGRGRDWVAWRRGQLLHAGFDGASATTLAAAGVDLHEMLDLVARGCSPRLAVRILTPTIPDPEQAGLA
ncbi:MAG: hypothetical protein ACRDRN_25310 [Sciscionella sp.]